MAEEAKDKPDESSKYNEAMLQIMRLNNLWIKIEENVNKGNLKEWQFLLDSVWRELRADVNHLKEIIKDGEIHTEKEKNFRFNKSSRLKVLVNAGISRTAWHKALNERHEFLKELQDDVGKGGVFVDGTEEQSD